MEDGSDLRSYLSHFMASEQSFQDRAQRATTLKEAVALMSPAYAPVDAKYSLAAFTTAITAAETANGTVETMRIPFDDQTDDREALTKAIGPLVTQSLAYVKSNTAWAKRYGAVKRAADKVRGVRPYKKKVADPDPDAKKRQQGERSFVEIAGFFRTYIDRVAALSGYAPTDLKITEDELTDRWTELDGFNKSLPGAAEALADAIADRLEAFTGAAALKFVFDGVKTSVKGQYGQASPEYQGIKGIKW
jgi:hypothetical protein